MPNFTWASPNYTLEDNITVILKQLQEEVPITDGVLLMSKINLVHRPPGTIPAEAVEHKNYYITGNKITWHKGAMKGMSKTQDIDGYHHIPPPCTDKEHDCHVLRQYGGRRPNEVPCTCGPERTGNGFVCCMVVYARQIAQWEQKLQIVGLLKNNMETLCRQIGIIYLMTNEEDKDYATLGKAIEDIRTIYRQAVWDINKAQYTGVSQVYADAVLEHYTPTGAPLDEFLKDVKLGLLVGKLKITKFEGQMWPLVARQMREINRRIQGTNNI